MLEIPASKVSQIILLAKKYDAKVGAWPVSPIDADAAEDPDSILEDFNSDATRSELAQFIAGLNVDEQTNLVALVWVGRGTYSADQFDEERNNSGVITEVKFEDAVNVIINNLTKEIDEAKVVVSTDFSACNTIRTIRPYFDSILFNLIYGCYPLQT